MKVVLRGADFHLQLQHCVISTMFPRCLILWVALVSKRSRDEVSDGVAIVISAPPTLTTNTSYTNTAQTPRNTAQYILYFTKHFAVSENLICDFRRVQ